MFNSQEGYIYIRRHESYDMHNACKFGITNNIPERDQQYATGEIRRGYFSNVIEMNIKDTRIFEKLFQNFCKSLNYHVKIDGGVEFFDIKIVDILIPYLNKTNIKYRILSIEEINNLVRKERLKKIKSLLYNKIKKKISYKPRYYQQDIIEKSKIHFVNNSKGILLLTCGLGKTLLSLWIAKKCNSKRILIGVPNKQLLDQWMKEIMKVFSYPSLAVSGNININDINNFMKDKNEYVIITTYSSCYKILESDYQPFDFKINDEMHHLSTSMKICEERRKKFINMLYIQSKKQLSLTATLKLLDQDGNDENNIISNDDIQHFGEIIDKKSLLWGIQNNIICDYVVQTVISHDLIFDLNEIGEDKRLLISAYAALRSLYENNTHHILICCNTTENATKINEYIKKLLIEYFDMHEIYHSQYTSKMSNQNRKQIIDNFSKSKKGIIVCVYCLGEGWNLPLLDGIVIAENMTSNIRIVQTVLRPNRKHIEQPDKICKIILPIYIEDWNDKNSSEFQKVRDIIYQLGMEDESIEQKIKVYDIQSIKKKKDNLDDNSVYDNINEDMNYELKLRTIKRIAFGTSYEKAKKILADKNIKSKIEYYELCERDNRLSSEPEEFYKNQFTNWIDYLNIDRNQYYDLKTCKEIIQKYMKENIKCYDISIVCNKLYENDNKFPHPDLWCDFYQINDVSELIKISIIKKKIIF